MTETPESTLPTPAAPPSKPAASAGTMRMLAWTTSRPRRPGLYLLCRGFIGPDIVTVRRHPESPETMQAPGWAVDSDDPWVTLATVPRGALWLGPLPPLPKAGAAGKKGDED